MSTPNASTHTSTIFVTDIARLLAEALVAAGVTVVTEQTPNRAPEITPKTPTKVKMTAAETKRYLANQARMDEIKATLEANRKAANLATFSSSNYTVGSPCPGCKAAYVGIVGKNHKFACKYTQFSIGDTKIDATLARTAIKAGLPVSAKDGHWVPVAK